MDLRAPRKKAKKRTGKKSQKQTKKERRETNELLGLYIVATAGLRKPEAGSPWPNKEVNRDDEGADHQEGGELIDENST